MTYKPKDYPYFNVTTCLTTKNAEYWNNTYQLISTSLDLEKIANQSFAIYPNPSSGYFTVDNENDRNYKIEVIDLLGNNLPFSENGNTVDLSNLNDGVYFIQIAQDGRIFSKKVMIAR